MVDKGINQGLVHMETTGRCSTSVARTRKTPTATEKVIIAGSILQNHHLSGINMAINTQEKRSISAVGKMNIEGTHISRIRAMETDSTPILEVALTHTSNHLRDHLKTNNIPKIQMKS